MVNGIYVTCVGHKQVTAWYPMGNFAYKQTVFVYFVLFMAIFIHIWSNSMLMRFINARLLTHIPIVYVLDITHRMEHAIVVLERISRVSD